MQQAEKAAPKAEPERRGHFGLEMQRGVVQLQLLQRIAERLVVVRTNREQTREYARLDLPETGQWSRAGLCIERDRIAGGRPA